MLRKILALCLIWAALFVLPDVRPALCVDESVAELELKLAEQEKTLGPEHPEVANTLNNLAALYNSQARYADAEPLHKRALAIREKVLGPDHPLVAQSLNNLATLYDNWGQTAKAESLYLRALAVKEKTWGRNTPTRPEV